MPLAPPADVAVQLIVRIEAAVSTRLSARQRAIDVSSVHSSGVRRNGPPPIMSVTWVERAGRLESERRAKRIADGEARSALV
jgi:hypothetical protein